MKYIASCSGGKDSVATVILAHENNEPLDLVIFSEVMFDEDISGELPEHIGFVRNKLFPTFEKWGYKTKILRSDKTYMDCFYHVVERSSMKDRVGKYKGFVMSGHCDVQRDCKLKPIRKFYKTYPYDYKQYIGIALDEKKRLKRLGENEISLLEKYGFTEDMAKQKCKQYGLLSPIYNFSNRGGCWFCPNMRERGLRRLRKEHPKLWRKLLMLEEEENTIGFVFDTRSGKSIHYYDERFRGMEMAKLKLCEYLSKK